MKGIPIRVHKVNLFPCANLKKIFLDSTCYYGRCKYEAVMPTIVLLPDIKYKYLKLSVNLLYMGTICCSSLE